MGRSRKYDHLRKHVKFWSMTRAADVTCVAVAVVVEIVLRCVSHTKWRSLWRGLVRFARIPSFQLPRKQALCPSLYTTQPNHKDHNQGASFIVAICRIFTTYTQCRTPSTRRTRSHRPRRAARRTAPRPRRRRAQAQHTIRHKALGTSLLLRTMAAQHKSTSDTGVRTGDRLREAVRSRIKAEGFRTVRSRM